MGNNVLKRPAAMNIHSNDMSEEPSQENTMNQV